MSYFLFYPQKYRYCFIGGCAIGRGHGHNLRVSKRSERNLCWLCDKSLPIRASTHSKHGRQTSRGRNQKCLIVALLAGRPIDVNKWPEGHCMASPWRGHKQTKQQKRRQWRKQQQHQIGKSKLHVLHEGDGPDDQTRPKSGSGPVAFLVSRKFTAASHPFCLCFVCLF